MDNPIFGQLSALSISTCRTFKLVRTEDLTGNSGTGIVAEGIEFSNGMCALCWLQVMSSIATYPNVKQLIAIHGHNGRTVIKFDDEP
jgi:hypothetical protein